jgi:hypothetical protein
MSRWLVLSDLQLPFEAARALPFVKAVAKEFGIDIKSQNPQRDGGVLCVGDETDHYFGSMYDHDPDALHTPVGELKLARRKVKAWGEAFPYMLVADSNHGKRWARKASKAQIPREFMRSYQEVHKMPAGWKFADEWLIKARDPFLLFHGCGYSSMYAYRHIAMDKGISTVFGHLHSSAGIAHVVTGQTEASRRTRWGMNVGCLIDPKAYVFSYGNDSKFKPWLGVGVVLDGGRMPVLVPYEAF